jgi:NAD(P)-dependent dehydrogenase (short-subunit alcohol dehydrogenase family)
MYLEKFRLDDRVAIITGGAKGIGRAIADALAEAGAVVVLCDTDRETGAHSVRDIRTAGGRAEFLFLDVTDGAAVESAASHLLATYGRLDIAVNNAGMCRNAPALEALDADWNGVIDLNLNGVYRCACAFGRHMVARKSGSMVNISSMAGEIIVRPQPQAAYNASKGGC